MSDEHYTGPERRHFQRRVNKDRRQMIRFEPEREPRRSGDERRKFSAWDHRTPF